ncbi:MAG: SHOCT-like domain-containing protein [Ktedonobacteraceae bacterium]
MAASIDERNRILYMVESGKVTAAQAAQLLDTLELEREHMGSSVQARKRIVRVRVTNLASNRQKFNVTVPVGLINVGLRLGARLVPQVNGSALEDLVRAIESGTTGRLLDLQDMEEGERVEIFAE